MRSSPMTGLVLCALAAVSPVVAFAVNIPPGYDLLHIVAPTNQDFAWTPIPVDFFDPGSDPFDSNVYFKGHQFMPACGIVTGNINIVIERKASASLPNVGDSWTVPIEIVQLSLVSVNPITVTYNGGLNPEQWVVEMSLPATYPAPGQMTITKTHANGGTFDAEFRVQPLLTFTRVADGAVRLLDGMIIDDFVCSSVPWVHDPYPLTCPSCGTTNFFPGISNGNAVTFALQAANAVQTVAPSCSGPVGSEQTSWGAVKVLYRE